MEQFRKLIIQSALVALMAIILPLVINSASFRQEKISYLMQDLHLLSKEYPQYQTSAYDSLRQKMNQSPRDSLLFDSIRQANPGFVFFSQDRQKLEQELDKLQQEQKTMEWIIPIALVVAVLITLALYSQIQSYQRNKSSNSSDERISTIREQNKLRSLEEEIEQLEKEKAKAKQNEAEQKKLKEQLDAKLKALEDEEKRQEAAEAKSYGSFVGYFQDWNGKLDEYIARATEQGTAQQRNGRTAAVGGIAFFILSIIVWQIVIAANGGQWHSQYLGGMISCSLLFIFIEFLAAWYLRQYRQFVDTSTYLLKLQALFDRVVMAYLLYQETEDSAEKKEAKLVVQRMLEQPVAWPESYLGKNADVSFAREAMQSMTHLAQTLRQEAKGKTPSS